MKTVVVSSRLAGGGKSTLGCQIAAAAQSLEYAPVVVIDTTRNATALRWGEARGKAPPVCVRSNADRLPSLVAKLALNRTALAVIDTAPFHLVSARAACALADLVLVPVTATPEGIAAARKMTEVARQTGVPALIVINRLATLPDRTMLAAFREIAELPPAVVRRHALFAACMADGRTVFEAEPFGDVARDIHELWNAMAFLLEADGPAAVQTAAE